MSDRIFTVILAGHDMSSNKGSKSAANAMKSCMRSKVSVAKIVDTAHLYESVWISLIFSQFQETEGILKDESLCMSSANHHQFVLWLVVKHHKVTLVSQGMRSKTWGYPPNGIDSNWLTKNAQFHIFSLMLLYLYLQEIQVGRFSRVHEPNKIGFGASFQCSDAARGGVTFLKRGRLHPLQDCGTVHCALYIVHCKCVKRPHPPWARTRPPFTQIPLTISTGQITFLDKSVCLKFREFPQLSD